MKEGYVGIRIDKEDLERFDEICDKSGVSRSQGLRNVIRMVIKAQR